MKRYKKIYILSIILIAVVITSVYFSYAFFANKNEQHGKLNVVVGDLKYTISSNDLNNNSITVAAGETKTLTISIASLNSISSKYELYYNLSNGNNVEVGYTNTPASGTIGAHEVVNIDITIRNTSSSSSTITFGLDKGLSNNTLVMSGGLPINVLSVQENLCEYEIGESWTFDYTGSEANFVVPEGCSGTYKLETWGAEGGSAIVSGTPYSGGYGAYAVGNMKLTESQKLYINVGGTGASPTAKNGTSAVAGGYNGGGKSKSGTSYYIGTGGGATHIATTSGLLSTLSAMTDNLIIVAGGGGAGSYQSSTNYGTGGHAGGIVGNSGTTANTSNTAGTGGTQDAGGTGGAAGSFGAGGTAGSNLIGGGGGYYGGGAGKNRSGSGGGSSYIGSQLITDKAMYCYNCQTSNDADTKTISVTNVSSNPTPNYAKQGNGYAKITLVELSPISTGTTWNYAYINGEHVFIVPVGGEYKLEAWGAEGGSAIVSDTPYSGGYGAYAVGNISLLKGETLYINVGGAGASPTAKNGTSAVAGGYNGGGQSKSGTSYYIGTGGGATHIALKTGLLSSLSSDLNRVLIVSGGGGAGSYQSATAYGTGGHAGGIVGNSGTTANTSNTVGTGGTQTAGGTGGGAGSFGAGASAGTNLIGGGGGYYGGGAGKNRSGSGGGSSYIGNTFLTDKAMHCYNCQTSNDVDTKTISVTNVSSNPTPNYAKQGNGYAKLTYVSPTIDSTNVAVFTGDIVNYADIDWIVVSDNSDTLTLITKNNYTTGKYGASTTWSSSNAYTKTNVNFLADYPKIQSAINSGDIILDQTSNSYVRLITKSEVQDLGSQITNGSGTAFWTMTPSSSNMYYALSNGGLEYTKCTAGSESIVAKTQDYNNGCAQTLNRGCTSKTSNCSTKVATTADTTSTSVTTKISITLGGKTLCGYSGHTQGWSEECGNTWTVSGSEVYYYSTATSSTSKSDVGIRPVITISKTAIK